MMDAAYALAQLRPWLKRRSDRGEAATADEVWASINRRWPRADEWQRERVFQASR